MGHLEERSEERLQAKDSLLARKAAAAIRLSIDNDHLIVDLLTNTNTGKKVQAHIHLPGGGRLIVDPKRGAVTSLSSEQHASEINPRKWDYEAVEALFDLGVDEQERINQWRKSRKKIKDEGKQQKLTDKTLHSEETIEIKQPGVLKTVDENSLGERGSESPRYIEADTEKIMNELFDFLRLYVFAGKTHGVTFQELTDPEDGWFNDYDPGDVAAALELMNEVYHDKIAKKPFLAKPENAVWRYKLEN